ncbi:hypothetical protein K1T35_47400 (plasmid) [Pseudonocardia sp. DSM 110487]|uniref:hypothetical protein n=1 Tax=Pseudonocardia sp. DSM 110487 TaxID=2865833 RepID=UPI001C6A4234|nr:hypothetical protein [Pseudonocardia sp. DSM 110487]QYN40976.1 hypothetical protein K1T35_47400 [Pseudonocardia sp. DSM 110487]
MGWFFSSKPNQELDAHERAHERAYKALGIPYRIVDRRGVPVLEGRISHSKSGSRKGAIALYAGYLAGGGDDEGDRAAALGLAREAGMSEDEVRREAQKYV